MSVVLFDVHTCGISALLDGRVKTYVAVSVVMFTPG
jgi:hypothetical protein